MKTIEGILIGFIVIIVIIIGVGAGLCPAPVGCLLRALFLVKHVPSNNITLIKV
ncbi:MAG: hypothetical protein GF334_05890 [Candidatus Altiarchaeales archaeon]|nr:hypothetical protein [Candidatus Altiarchaeales archaeon]